jgi:hypothetical protein
MDNFSIDLSVICFPFQRTAEKRSLYSVEILRFVQIFAKIINLTKVSAKIYKLFSRNYKYLDDSRENFRENGNAWTIFANIFAKMKKFRENEISRKCHLVSKTGAPAWIISTAILFCSSVLVFSGWLMEPNSAVDTSRKIDSLIIVVGLKNRHFTDKYFWNF